MTTTIGFIGQGWIGKHYADDFEARGYKTVRYALEEPYVQNRAKLKDCEIIFIAVPTPTTAKGFSYEPVESALDNIAVGTTVVIKSTMLPGVTSKLQKKFPKLFIMHSPEFLREVTAAYDAANPDRNIVGISIESPEFVRRAEAVLKVLPSAKYEKVMPALEAEMVKYVGNCFLYSKVMMTNAFYDVVTAVGGDWETVREGMVQDPRIGASHSEPVHNSGHDESEVKSKRGAGGHCFIKDFEAFRRFSLENVNDEFSNIMISSMIDYNNHLLIESEKDLDLLEGVYGKELLRKHKQ